ncbi:MAG TPA: PTS sugar transporter subunit IIA, partial [Thermoanaerobaculia bacterium]
LFCRGMPVAPHTLLDARDVHLQFRADSIVAAIPPLLGPALVRIAGEAAAESIVADVVKREQEGATKCGPIGLPHTRSAAVDEFVLAVAVNPDGVIAGDAEPRIMFAFVSPAARRQEHLNLLAALARLSQNAAVVDQIVRATSPEQVVETLRALSF